jgi:hypothetical protein
MEGFVIRWPWSLESRPEDNLEWTPAVAVKQKKRCRRYQRTFEPLDGAEQFYRRVR